MTCPDNNTLINFIGGHLDLIKQWLVESHLSECAECADRKAAFEDEGRSGVFGDLSKLGAPAKKFTASKPKTKRIKLSPNGPVLENRHIIQDLIDRARDES